MVNFGDFVIGIVLTGVFMFALFGFGIQVGIDNATNQSIGDDPLIAQAYLDINKSLAGVQGNLDDNKKGFFRDVISDSTFGIVLDSIVGIGSLIVNGFLQGMFQTIANLIAQTLGLNSTVVFSIMMSFFIITSILLAWRVYRAGT